MMKKVDLFSNDGMANIFLADPEGLVLFPEYPFFQGDSPIVYDPRCEVCDWKIVWEADNE